MFRRKMLEIGAMIALGIDYAAAYVTAYVWHASGSELIIHILIIFVFSLLYGALIIDLEKTIFYTMGSIVIGASLAIVAIVAPSLTLTGNIELLNFEITVALHFVGRFLIIGITFIIVGAIIGCFVGDAMSEQSEI